MQRPAIARPRPIPGAIAQNHYEGPVRRTTSLAQLNRLLKDPDAVEPGRWEMLVKGGMHFHKHPKTGIEHQLWTDEKEGTVAFQKLQVGGSRRHSHPHPRRPAPADAAEPRT